MVYDGSGNLISFTDVAGGVWVFTYDGFGQMLTMRRPNQTSGVVENAYDGAGRVLWQEDELDRRTSFAYDTPVAGAVQVTYPSGMVRVDEFVDGRREATTIGVGTSAAIETSYAYDPETIALEAVTTAGVTTTFTNDAVGNRLSVTDASGRVTRWTYNSFDQPTSVAVGETTAPLPASTAAVVTSTMTYDTNGLLTAAVDAQGTAVEATTTYVYGDSTHPEDLTAVIDARSKAWSFTYDPNTGDVLTGTDPLSNTTSFGHDGIGRTVTATTPEGGTTSWVYDDINRTITTTDATVASTIAVYDPAGNLAAQTTGISATTPGDTTTYAYNAADELTTVDPPGPGAKSYAYTPDGLRASFVNENGGVWSYGYDPVGRLISTQDPAGAVTGYGYDSASRLAWVRQPGAGSSCSGTKVDCVSYSYDAAGRVTGVDYSDPATGDLSGFVYDALGRRTSVSQGSSGETWSWDERSRLVSHSDVNGRSTGYGWDAGSNLVSILYPGQGVPLTRAFDDAGRLSGVTDWAGRTTSFGYDDNSNWTDTVFPAVSQNVDVRTYDAADRLSSVAWMQGSTTLGSLSYGARDAKGMVTSVTATGAGGGSNTWSYDSRDRLTATASEGFGFDAATNLVDHDGVLQVLDPAQRLCWTSPTATGGDCSTPTVDATSFDYDARGNRTAMTLPSGTASHYGFDAENRMTSAVVPAGSTVEQRQFQVLAGGAERIVDATTGVGTCNGVACGPIGANTATVIDVAGEGTIPAVDVTAVTGTITVTDPGGDGWLRVNPNGDASASMVRLIDGQGSTATFTAALDGNGRIEVVADVDVTVAVDVSGFWTPPPVWVPALNYWTVDPVVAASSAGGTGICDGQPCGVLPVGETDVVVAGVGGVPVGGVAAVTVSVMAYSAGVAATVRVAPNGDASAGEIGWDSVVSAAAGVFTVPVNPDGTITLETTAATSVAVSVSGYWKVPASTDTGLGLHLGDGPVRVYDTATATGTCVPGPCGTLGASTPVAVAVAGQQDVPVGAAAVMVSANFTNPAGDGFATVGAGSGANTAVVLVGADQVMQASMIVALSDTGTIEVVSSVAADVSVDVVGWFTMPTSTYTYEYGPTGLRSAKTLTGTGGTRVEYTWSATGGMGLMLAEHRGAQTSYVVYGPGGTPIYQVTRDGQVIYYHQDHQGSTRLTTGAFGNSRGTLDYDAHGQIIANTQNPWAEQALLGYTGQYHDTETGYIYLRARHYDPTTAQFTSLDPIVAITQEPYGYVYGNPANRADPYGLGYDVGAHTLPERGDVSDNGGRCYEPPKKNRGKEKRVPWGNRSGWEDDAGNIWVWDKSGHGGPHWDVQHDGGKSHTNVDEKGSVRGDDNFPTDKGKVNPTDRTYLDYPMSTLDYLSGQAGGVSQGAVAGAAAIITVVILVLTAPAWLLSW